MDAEVAVEAIDFDVLKYVRGARALYGLKHGDYKRYRCAASPLGTPESSSNYKIVSILSV